VNVHFSSVATVQFSSVADMTERGVRVEEEQVLPILIADLRAGTAH
jgi:hypothetical protein